MIPAVCESQCEAGSVDGLFDIGGDHSASAVDNDPFSDRLYWYNPQDMSPGEGGYQAYFGGADDLGDVVMRRMVLVLLNGGGEPPYTASMPETGTVFRIAGQVPIAPIPASPGDDAMLAGPSVPFYWNGQDGDIFRLEIARDPDFDLPIELEFEVPGQTVPLEESGRYYWRVRGLSGAWSTVWAFDLATGTSIESGISGAEKLREVQLFANYPNPFNPTTVISYELPEAADVRLEVFDVLGRRVRVLQEARVPAGLHRVALDAGALSSGVYFYTLSAGGVERTRRMVLLR
jgi:hypothetical protein